MSFLTKVAIPSGLLAAILHFRYMAASYNIANSTIQQSDLENMGVAVEILFLGAIEPEICLGVFLPPPPSTLTGVKTPSAYEGFNKQELVCKCSYVLTLLVVCCRLNI
jgi:hypothetical protein